MESYREAFYEQKETEKKHHYGLYRFIMAVMLFCTLICAFRMNVSYKGWNQQRIEEILSDDSSYKRLMDKAQMVMKAVMP